MEKNSLVQHHRKKDFEDYLDDLFDMAHQKALHIKTIREDKQFLLVQWDKGTRGLMASVDNVLARKEP